jgi:hypothetical protein
MAGIENMKRAVEAVLQAQPDAVQLSVGHGRSGKGGAAVAVQIRIIDSVQTFFETKAEAKSVSRGARMDAITRPPFF